jgi:multiple sugar transport system permease protein
VPLLWVVLAAFNGNPSQGIRIMWPDPFTLANFTAVLTPETTYQPFLNGLVLCAGGTLITMICATLVAYPLSRYRSRLKRPFLVTILFSTGLPITAIMVPVYGLFVQLALDDSIAATMVFMATTALPISIWLCKNFMDGVPIELEEAAWTDGSTRFQAIRRVVLPLAGPGLGAAAMLIFMGSWGDFLTPLVLLQDQNLYPLAIGLFRAFSEHDHVDWGLLAASAIVYVAPPAVLYVFVRKHLLRSSLGGAVKG